MKHIMERKKMKSLNLKSIVIGAFLIVLLFLLLGASSGNQPAGQYRLCMSTGSRGDLYFARIDTKTGQVETWKMKPLQFQAK